MLSDVLNYATTRKLDAKGMWQMDTMTASLCLSASVTAKNELHCPVSSAYTAAKFNGHGQEQEGILP